MTDEDNSPEQTMRNKIIRETAKIAWRELMRQFAGGNTLVVAGELDVIEVAYQLHQDNATQVAHWLKAEQVRPVSDGEAGQWYEEDRLVWASVVKPWVLVQLHE